ncbi:hypothetical protein C1646_678031 [Rhizophagus diaphanus]|nr:hypothetical protein C1646_678031 [Rhizophagus diaphanus] [Rhizophagus sp. MUCL 43196]
MAGTTVRVPIAERKFNNTLLSIATFFNRVFIYDYLRSSKIEAHFQSNERLYISYYNIISLGTYPSTPKLTQKSKNNASQYPIPDVYIVETEFSERSLICKTKYISVSKKINLKSSTKSSGSRLFGFDIEPLYHAHLQIGFQPVTAVTTEVNNRKRLLEDITSHSQQNKRFNSFRRDVQKAVDELIVKHKLTNLSGKPILYL